MTRPRTPALTLTLTVAAGALSACGPKAPPQPAAAVDYHATMPDPLPPRPFQLPEPQRGTLSNGIPVVVVENHEVPLVQVQVALRPGDWTDPPDLAGLASVTMDMLNEGAGGMSAAELSSAARRMGSSVWTGSSLDGASVGASCLTDKLPGTLDLLATVMLEPDFPDADWELMRKKRLQAVQAARKDPNAIAGRVWNRLGYGDHYAGHLDNEAAYQAIDTERMRAWYDAYVVPANAMIVVGGDTTLEEIQPLLEARFGSWNAEGQPLPELPSADSLPPQPETTVFLVDKPEAAQSVLRVGRFAGTRLDPDYDAFQLGNMAIGGQFTARINMNLREDKSWTYGARSWLSDNYLPSRWQVGTSVFTPTTADAVSEIMRELDESLGTRPITQEELDNSRGYLLGTWPLRFENPGELLGGTVDIWRYGLPDDWITGLPDRMRAVTLEQTRAAWAAHIDPTHLSILVVGDAATVEEPLEALGYPVQRLDVEGFPVEEDAPVP
ncbi:MAG: insulinase family protein [Deltaproteobacteria bacterium]|nr:MAG: insulinase family protein [Deltaproteobacteria bacterium]